MRNSYDSAARPLGNVHYQDVNDSDYDPYYSGAYADNTVPRQKKGVSRWIKFGIPIAIIIIAAAVVGAIIGIRDSHKNASTSSSSSSNNDAEDASVDSTLARFATGTDTYLLPIYPSTTDAAIFIAPTFLPQSDTILGWPEDPFQPANPAPTSVRPDRPRLIAPSYKWEVLPQLIAQSPYLASWNESIFGNATDLYSQPPVAYVIDGGLGESGILDPSREVKERIKVFAYVYRMTNQTLWIDRTWAELLNAAGNGTQYFGPTGDNWNSDHFLDVGEFTAAFAIAYDWLYDAWTEQQREAIMWSIITNGLNWGIQAYTNTSTYIGWWRTGIEGNWNCVCNNGLTMGALAILGDDPTGVSTEILGLTIPNTYDNCAQGPSTDGTWAETANYWYFGISGHAEMASSLLTATGSYYELLSVNPDFNLTSLYHMYVTGMTSLFNYGDHGPNKYSTTANGLMFYGEHYNMPMYTLFQRDRIDASEPWSMFWYDPNVAGAFWDDLPLDHFFENDTDQWVSMRSSWTSQNGTYIAMKAGNLTNHQTHGDLDSGDFVFDAIGQRWAGELGSDNYDSPGYFSSEAQDSERWLYYRKRTEGQNTIVVNYTNQDVLALPTCNYSSSGTVQGSSTVLDLGSNSTAYFTVDLTTTYFGADVKRGIRFINSRLQVLLQDDVTDVTTAVQWRMHTNATVDIASSGTSATLTLAGETLIVDMLNPPTGAAFTQGPAVRYSTDPPLPAGTIDMPNPGVTVLMITMAPGTYSLQVLFTPQWPGMDSSDYQTPPSVPVTEWTLTSHDPQ